MDYCFSQRIISLQPSVIREILKFTADPSVIPFAAGNPAAEAFPVKEIAEITADILSNEPISALQYSVSEGYTPLREAVEIFVQQRENLGRMFDQYIIVSGAQQGIELTTKCLCNEGDTIICEAPSFIGSLNTFRSYKTHLVGVPMEEDGMDMDALEAALKANPNTRFIYTIPNFQTPAGLTTSLEKRRHIYALAKQYGVMILEDNPYGDLRFAGEHIPAIKSLDEDGIVIYCGSFSKIISPGMRVGFVVAPALVTAKLVVAKQCSDVHSNILAQMICHRFLTTCDTDAHIRRIREIYKEKCGQMLSLMDGHFPKSVTYTRPEGGLFIWAALPAGSDMLGFCKEAVEKKVAVVPGSAFMVDESDPTTHFRLNFSTPAPRQIEEGVEILGKLLAEKFA